LLYGPSGKSTLQKIHFIDAAKIFETMSPGNTPGRELFLKHVHLNFQGYYRLAKAVFEQIRPILPTRYVAGDIR